MERFWVPRANEVFVPCFLQGQDGTNAKFADDSGEVTVLPVSQLSQLHKVLDSQLLGVDNVCALEEVCPAALLHTVRARFARQLVYTRVSRILIAVNPFKMLNIYSSRDVDNYSKGMDSMDLPPHIFGIGLDAVNGLRKTDSSQAVLISGESGAGKTESTKLVLRYVSEAIGSSGGGIQDKVTQTNPVLEAFGNAMTVRNNNSSRFGKWLEMGCERQSMKLVDCSVTDYLLELTRVCVPGEKERNYHIFFQLAHNRTHDDLKSLGLMAPKEYRYLSACQEKAPGISDAESFEELRDAFNTLGFSPDAQTQIYSVVAGLLTLGNCDFNEEADAAKVADSVPIEKASALLGVNSSSLLGPMLKRKLVVGKEVTETPRTAAQARAVRDGLAKLLYGRLFKWLIRRINQTLSIAGGVAKQFFGVLDIAGFESFEKNSLEQLFINLSNERMQQHFNNHIFKLEMEDYKAEGVSVENMTFQDNSDIVDLLEAKGGLLSILEEELSMPKATDQTFLAKVFKAHEKHARMIKPKFSGTLNFGIRHFAGEVTYGADGFLDKNVDKPPEEAPAIFGASTCGVLKEIGKMMEDELAAVGTAAAGKSKKPRTVSSEFRASLAKLVDKLNHAEPHFIRCIKPNAAKVPERFESKLAMDQLTCSGVFEAVRIRQRGFSSRIPFADFVGRFRPVIPKAMRSKILGTGKINADQSTAKACSEALAPALTSFGGVQAGELVVGLTKVFMKMRLASSLEKARDLAIASHCVVIQRVWRGQRVRKMMREVNIVMGELKVWLGKNNFYQAKGSAHIASAKLSPAQMEEAVDKAQALVQKAERLPLEPPQLATVKKICTRMTGEAAMVKQLEALKTSMEPLEIEKTIARVAQFEIPQDGAVASLSDRSKKLKTQLPLVKAMQDALADDEDDAQLAQVVDALRQAELHDKASNWIPQLEGSGLAKKIMEKWSVVQAKIQSEAAEAAKNAPAEGLAAAAPNAASALKRRTTVAKPPPEDEDGGRRKTITGLDAASQERLLIGLLAASHEFDVAALEDQLSEAVKQGLDPKDIEKADTLFKNLQTEAFLIDMMREHCAKVEEKDEVTHAVKCLRNLIAQAQSLGVAEDKVIEAKKVMQIGVRARARSTIRGSIFSLVDMDEFELMDDAFSDIYSYTGLKQASKWRGHRASRLLSWGTKGAEVMMYHSTNEIKEALTQVPPDLDGAAVQTFRDVLGWMHDRPVPSCQRLGFAQAIVECAASKRAMADETYVQLMKQLSRNPSRRSILFGWKLMLLLCQQVSPSAELMEFLRTFLMRALKEATEDGFDEAAGIAKQCLADLNITAAPNLAAGEEGELIPVQVLLIDNSTRKIHVRRDADLAQLGEKLSEILKIHNGMDFTFFQLTEGLDTHRLLPENTALEALSEKWLKLKEVTGRNSRLLYKRRFLRIDETLNAGDLVHANLTYRQVLWDYQKYPVSEDHGYLCRVAATIVLSDPDLLAFMNGSRLAEQGVLEMILPEIALREQQSRSQWARQITDVCKRIEREIDPAESGLLRMSRVMALIQQMKLFGAYCWLGKQTFTVPPEKVSVPEAPAQMCKINPREAEAEYWICLDLYGVRFLPLDPVSGWPGRGFLFNEEAPDRVLRWGARQNVLQFVVQALNPALPGQGRVPMCISLVTPAAIDIAFAIHVLCNDRSLRR
eukprot:TRINITY_DN111650_c0_g1_i1.p1 TRINITY_DN111650_c0_g1~~TRINITY_DN111650_c0_g1_i1.p1  ORF type:complete len:1685 (+),score=409.16 TRINITY_DN111650_c0_g1_i1:39-5057(+)